MELISKAVNFSSLGYLDKREAKKIAKIAKSKEKKARLELEEQKKITLKSLSDYGELKAKIYSTTINNFIVCYEKIGKVDARPFSETDEKLDSKSYKKNLIEMKNTSIRLKEMAILTGGSALSGAVAIGGALGLASLIGTASTGTAIGSLSGIAATNATMAWLGGGAISAGGAGIAGGIVVLGGIALAPLVVFGMFLGTQKGKQKLNATNDYSDQVDVLIERIITLIAELAQIRRGVNLFKSSIITLDKILDLKMNEMNSVIRRLEERTFINKTIIDPVKKVFNINILTDKETQIIVDTSNCAFLLRQLIDKPLLNSEGAFLSEALNYLNNKNEVIALMEKN